ncbi:imidazole glycerol phosphate synthase subunit HisH [Tessaracoccus antarcticus]|uniref:Imidazole glycerol phosphate synthase subunit HisH n=1 Tax=Tessaracoccus antarcticus TaxID=2479848 RepID=A0A3M0G1C7_9ACTN|nr:imidazole glycerol phosphate synthase subunit HisH [Tessaracoccus antarcticus]RMB58770.1 imidazole glycerol phosphate synthase subunit HisH [Tessaracoccus antarcticus]
MVAPRVGLLDYGSGNLHSAARALSLAGAVVTVTSDLGELRRQDRLVVPGVGAFAACMRGIDAVGGRELITGWLAEERPLLGICVGHQILFGTGTEHGLETPGLGVLAGSVEKLPARRLPHMGWNDLQTPGDSRLFRGIAGERFYFVHSYAALVAPPDARVAMARHEDVAFVAAVERGSLSTTQFHPEKSGEAGLQLLRNWLES